MASLQDPYSSQRACALAERIIRLPVYSQANVLSAALRSGHYDLSARDLQRSPEITSVSSFLILLVRCFREFIVVDGFAIDAGACRVEGFEGYSP